MANAKNITLLGYIRLYISTTFVSVFHRVERCKLLDMIYTHFQYFFGVKSLNNILLVRAPHAKYKYGNGNVHHDCILVISQS